MLCKNILPAGRANLISEITGLEASGKSLLAAHALANCQKAGGLAVYIDTENAISREFLEAIGLDPKSDEGAQYIATRDGVQTETITSYTEKNH